MGRKVDEFGTMFMWKPRSVVSGSAIACFCVSLHAWSAPAAAPNDHPDLSFGTATHIDSAKVNVNKGVGPNVVLDMSGHFISTTVDKETSFNAEIYSDKAEKKAILFSINRERRQDGYQKSKIEMNLVGERHENTDPLQVEGEMKNGETHSLAFGLQFTKNYETPQRWAIHMQVYQCCVNGAHPPLVLMAVPDPDLSDQQVRLVVVRQDQDIMEVQKERNDGERLKFLDGSDSITLSKEQWHRIEFTLRPNQDQNGLVQLKIDGVDRLRFQGSFGYPASSGGTDNFQVKLGIYRPAQQTIQELIISDIIWQ